MNLDLNNIGDMSVSLKALVIAVICSFIFYFGYMSDFATLLRIIKGNKQQELDQKTQLTGLVTSQAIEQNNLAHLPQLQKTLTDWQGQLIKPNELSDLLNEILKIGTANNLQFDLFNPGEKIKEQDYIQVPIKVVVKGNYDQIANFISQLANMKWLVGIDSFIIGKPNEREKKGANQNPTDVGRIASELNLEVYYVPDK
jgi:type IV pilus assembly protein PilO